jgi:hypothetical protein
MLVAGAQPMWYLIDTSEGYDLGVLNMKTNHSHAFPYDILHFSLVA